MGGLQRLRRAAVLPDLQPEGRFIRRYLPQLAGFSAKDVHAPWRVAPLRQREAGCSVGTDYPAPIVDHAAARGRTLARYSVVKAR